MMRTVPTLILVVSVAAPVWSHAAQNPRNYGSFQLGMSVGAFRAAAKKAGLQESRRQAEDDRDVMGLGVMLVQPVTAESPDRTPRAGHPFEVTGYALAGRMVYLSLDYGAEDPARFQAVATRYGAPEEVRRALQDTTWRLGGVVLHMDRFGRELHAVDWEALKAANRVLVTLDGAQTVVNRFFRQLRAREAEESLELIRQKVQAYFRAVVAGKGMRCAPPPPVDLTPAETACTAPDRRHPASGAAWSHATWQALGIAPASLSRFYSFQIESSGELNSARVTITARGDLDCDDDVATLRVRLRADPRSRAGACSLDKGEWEMINPLE